MSIFQSFFPHAVLKSSSPYNQDVRVFGGLGGLRLFVNGSWQSGPYIRKLWTSAFRKFKMDALKNIRTILVLGVGGGTVIELLAKRFPHASIAAVDIDSQMLDIATKYFGIDKLAHVQFVCADAGVYLDQLVTKGTIFDLVVVDLFIGPKIPEFVSSLPFLKSLYAIIKSDGHCCINYLRELEYREKSDELMLRLNALWGHVEDMNLYNNRFFLAGT